MLALDLGTRRIGVAVCDPEGILATPRGFIERSGDVSIDHAGVGALVEELGVELVVVGLPLSLDGSTGAAAGAALAEAEVLSQILGLPVECHDERLTTVTAHRNLAAAGTRSRRRRTLVDASAAAVLLQSWLDSRR